MYSACALLFCEDAPTAAGVNVSPPSKHSTNMYKESEKYPSKTMLKASGNRRNRAHTKRPQAVNKAAVAEVQPDEVD